MMAAGRQASSMGTTRRPVAVISRISTMPVSGALTDEANIAPMPTMVQMRQSSPIPGSHHVMTAQKSAPYTAPMASIGANSPPDIPIEYDIGPSPKKKKKKKKKKTKKKKKKKKKKKT